MFLSRPNTEQREEILIDAVRNKRAEWVLKELEKSTDNEWIKHSLKGFKLLQAAVVNGFVGLTTYILDTFPERLNFQDLYGKSVLFYAVEKQQWDVVEYLMTKSINYNLVEKHGNTVLHIVAAQKMPKEKSTTQLELVKRLVSRRVVVNARNDLGETPLHIACLYANKSLVETLLSHKAKVEVESWKGMTPYEYSLYSDQIVVDLSQMSDEDVSSKGSPSDLELPKDSPDVSSEHSDPSTCEKKRVVMNKDNVGVIRQNLSPSLFKRDYSPRFRKHEKQRSLDSLDESKIMTASKGSTKLVNGNFSPDDVKFVKYRKYGIDEERYKKLEQTAIEMGKNMNKPKMLPPRPEYTKGKKFRVLSLDGGGVKCVYQCAVLKKISEKFPNFFNEIDLITGVSASSLPCAAICLGLDLETTQKMMEAMLYETFTREIHKAGIAGHQYSNKFLFVMGDQVFGNLKLEDVTKKMCIPSFLIDTGKNSEERESKIMAYNNFDGSEVPYSLTEVCIESAAAPGYFGSVDGHLDGGVIMNEPCGIVMPMILGEYGLNVDKDDLVILSLGAGYPAAPYIPLENVFDAGVVKWMPHMPDLHIESRKFFVELEAKLMLGDRFFRLNPKLPHYVDLDDCKDMELIKEMGNSVDMTETFAWLERNW
ncbi:ankyrin repeat-containing protein, putative [Entamoeba invadens IP1]|uniref:phospholipase A2 n=1 Tax=Entamoeba invadens IP1 TaxID=370355 RepID=A0A0A1TWT3_ENTIV|nr:ankyrin repeat-containing protein, putative [Entamoeba invadens IP1]ELP85656.1 ankyrin repeat-containing protein, putative [Entamoeba invadens IP1]|eukprot:XP_004185002.1 ankyrin repeat-containing protein, putative [Entamoeba invadens IP1]